MTQNGYKIFFDRTPEVGTEVEYFGGERITLERIGSYRRADGQDSVILQWRFKDGRVGTSGLRARGLYIGRTIEDAQQVSIERDLRRATG